MTKLKPLHENRKKISVIKVLFSVTIKLFLNIFISFFECMVFIRFNECNLYFLETKITFLTTLQLSIF